MENGDKVYRGGRWREMFKEDTVKENREIEDIGRIPGSTLVLKVLMSVAS